MSSDGEDVAQRQHAGRAVLAAGRRQHGVARVEQHGAALLHVGVDARQRGRRRARRARHDRPVDQREERELVARRIEPDRLAGFQRGALREEQREALQAELAEIVDLGVAGDDVGEPRLGGDLLGEFFRRGIRRAARPARAALRARGLVCAIACEAISSAVAPASSAMLAATRRRGISRYRPPASQNTTSASMISSASAPRNSGPRRSFGSPRRYASMRAESGA